MTKVAYAGFDPDDATEERVKMRERRVKAYREQNETERCLHRLRSWAAGTHDLNPRAVVDKIDDMLFELTAKRKGPVTK